MPNDFIEIDQNTSNGEYSGHWTQGSTGSVVLAPYSSGGTTNPVIKYDAILTNTYKHAFFGIAIPIETDTTIVSAYLSAQINGNLSNSSDYIDLEIKALLDVDWDYLSDGPDTGADADLLWNLYSTTASVTTRLTGLDFTLSYTKNLGDIKSIIQELVDQVGWLPDNRILLMIRAISSNRTANLQFGAAFKGVAFSYIHLSAEYYYDPLPADYDVHIEQELTFEQSIIGVNPKKIVEHELTIEQDIIGLHYNVRSLEHELELESTLRYYVNELPTQRVEDLIIILDDLSTSRVKSVEFESQLIIDQEYNATAPTHADLSFDTLTISQDINYSRVYSKDIEDELEIESEVRSHTRYASLEHSLDSIQSLVSEHMFSGIYTVGHTLIVDQDLSLKAVFTRNYEDDISSELDHFGLGYFDFDYWD